MADETEGQDAGAEASGAGVDPAAVALALSGASREDAGAFLKDQRELIADQRLFIGDQRHHLHEQFKQLRLNIWQQRLGVLLRIATGFVGVIVAAGLAYMIWDASQSSGLLIEPFSIPPDLAARGMTGEVVAAKLLDHLSEMQAQTNSTRAAQSYVNDWGQTGIKLEIPETGVSLNELDNFLREKLGHDTHITGEIVRTASGVSLTARTSGSGAESVTGPEADLDGLVEQLGENVYRLTQPYRYGIYLASHDRYAEAIPIFRALADPGTTRLDRAYGNAQWAIISGEKDGIGTESRLLQRAIGLEPENAPARQAVLVVHLIESLPEQVALESKKVLSTLSSNTLGMYSANTMQIYGEQYQSYYDQTLGGFSDAAQKMTEVVNANVSNSPQISAQLAEVEANEHDLVAARATLLDTANYRTDYRAGYTALFSIRSRMLIDAEAQNWAGILSDADAISLMLQKSRNTISPADKSSRNACRSSGDTILISFRSWLDMLAALRRFRLARAAARAGLRRAATLPLARLARSEANGGPFASEPRAAPPLARPAHCAVARGPRPSRSEWRAIRFLTPIEPGGNLAYNWRLLRNDRPAVSLGWVGTREAGQKS